MKRHKINKKEAGVGPFKKSIFTTNVKNVFPESGERIRTHGLLNMSLIPFTARPRISLFRLFYL